MFCPVVVKQASLSLGSPEFRLSLTFSGAGKVLLKYNQIILWKI